MHLILFVFLTLLAVPASARSSAGQLGCDGLSGVVYNVQLYDRGLDDSCVAALLTGQSCAAPPPTQLSSNSSFTVTLPGVALGVDALDTALAAATSAGGVVTSVTTTAAGDVLISVAQGNSALLNSSEFVDVLGGRAAVVGGGTPSNGVAQPTVTITVPYVSDLLSVNETGVANAVQFVFGPSAHAPPVAARTRERPAECARTLAGAQLVSISVDSNGGLQLNVSGAVVSPAGLSGAAASLQNQLELQQAFFVPTTGGQVVLITSLTLRSPPPPPPAATTYARVSVTDAAAWIATANWAAVGHSVVAALLLGPAAVQLELPAGVSPAQALADLSATATYGRTSAASAVAAGVQVTVSGVSAVGSINLAALAAAASPGSSIAFWRLAQGALVVGLFGGATPSAVAAAAVDATANLPPGAHATVVASAAPPAAATDLALILGLSLGVGVPAFVLIAGVAWWLSSRAHARVGASPAYHVRPAISLSDSPAARPLRRPPARRRFGSAAAIHIEL